MFSLSLAVAFGFRLQSLSFFTRDLAGHFNFIEADCYYQLRRLVFFLQNFPKDLAFDPLSDWPTGHSVDWPVGFVWLIGLPLKLFGVKTFREVEIGASTVMVLLGLLSVYFNFLLARKLLRDSRFSILVLFLTASNFLLARFSCLGEVDHHIVEALFPPLFLLLAFKSFEERSLVASVFLGFLCTFSLLVSSSSLFSLFCVFASYAYFLGNRENLNRFAVISLVFILSLFIVVRWEVLREAESFALNFPSYFHLTLALLFSVGALCVALSKRKLLTTLLMLAAFGVGSVAFSDSAFSVYLRAAVNYVLSESSSLVYVPEAQPIFKDSQGFNFHFIHGNFGFLFYLLPLAWFFLFSRKFSPFERTLLLFLSLLSIPGLLQKRFSHLIVCLFFVFVAMLFEKLARHFNFRERSLALIFLIASVLSILPEFEQKISFGGSPRLLLDLEAAGKLIKANEIQEPEVWDRLSGKASVDGGIWLNPNMGHLFLYLTGYGVTTNAFYHPSSFDLDFKLRTAKSFEELGDLLSKNRIRYLLVSDDWRMLMHHFEWRALPPPDERTLQSFAWARLAATDEGAQNLEEVFNLESKDSYTYRRIKYYRFKL